jgi:hypothetical protein
MQTFFSAAGVKVAVITAGVLLAGGVASASLAVGGPDVTSSVPSAILGTSSDPAPEQTETSDSDVEAGVTTGHERCAEGTQHALDRLNELQADGKPVDNAIQAVENCGNGSANQEETTAGSSEEDQASSDLPEQSNPNAAEQSDNASQGIGNANEQASNGQAHANEHAQRGSGNP